MPKESNIVHRYFKKKFDGATILVKVNPLQFKGIEITLGANGASKMRSLEFDENIFDDLDADGFEEANALEFNLYYAGLAK
ncbi:MAG TPA: hypothetical protein VFZ52_13505 [Chryseolinea sp.]